MGSSAGAVPPTVLRDYRPQAPIHSLWQLKVSAFSVYSLFDEMLMTILGSDPVIHGIDAALDLHIQNNLKPTCTLWPPGPAARMR